MFPDKTKFINPLLVIVVVILIGIVMYLGTTGDTTQPEVTTTENENTGTTQTPAPGNSTSYASQTGWQTHFDANYTVQYPTNTFALAGLGKGTLPPRYQVNYGGIKLIDASHLSTLGQQNCYYGESGLLTVCSVEKEAGIAIFEVDNTIDTLTTEIKDQITSTTLGSYDAKKWSAGAEGDGIEIYYIELLNKKTLIVQNQYTDIGMSYEFPPRALFEQIVDTLVIK